MATNEQIVLDAMKKANKSVRPGDIAKITGLESKEVSKVIKELKKNGKVISPKRCYYALAEE
jgi:predicted transcriptional regulator